MPTSNKGIYILELLATENFSIFAKKFIGITFPPGYYYYIGSAQKNLKSRIERHKRKTKIVHWHIDHITTHKSLRIVDTLIFLEAEKKVEAEIANHFIENFDAQIIVNGFGNSDTKETKTHLFFKKKRIEIREFQRFYNFQK